MWLNPVKVLFACLDSDIDLCSIDLEFFRKIHIFNTFHVNYWILNIITIHINSMGWTQMVYFKLSKRTNCFTQMIWFRNHWLTYNNCSIKRSPGLFRMKTNIFQQTGYVWFPWHVIKYCNSLYDKNHFTKKKPYKMEIIVSECHIVQWSLTYTSHLGTIPDFQKKSSP